MEREVLNSWKHVSTKDGRTASNIIEAIDYENGLDDAVVEKFLKSINDYKNDIIEYFGISNYEYDEIAKRAVWILYQESYAWKSKKYKFKEFVHKITFSLLPGNWSRWYTQIKFKKFITNQDDKLFLSSFGITSWKDLSEPEKCWIATMISLVSNYKAVIIPMKIEWFWRNDATIIKVFFANNKKQFIAKGKALDIDWEIRPRTEKEIQEIIRKYARKNGWIIKQEEIIRKWIMDNDKFFDFLYYCWYKPSEIIYWTATPDLNSYIQQCNMYVSAYEKRHSHTMKKF